MKTITTSFGDYLDRFSILTVKQEKGLDVTQELDVYNFDDMVMHYYFIDILVAIHNQLWDIEDTKRVSSKRYTDEYSDLSTLTCQLNDIRHKVKKEIDLFYGSEFTEQKSHKI